MSYIKASLKAARDGILSGDFDSALEFSNDVLGDDPDNFNALLFKGKALDAKQMLEEASKVYHHAVAVKKNDPLPWKGLIAMYQSTDDYKAYLDSMVGLIKCYEASDDVQSALKVLINAQKHFMTKFHNKSRETVAFLQLEIPGSPIYDFLEAHMPALDLTLEKLIEHREKLEKQFSSSATVSSAANLSQWYESMKKSDLLSLYEQLADITENDTVRASCEQKLVQLYVALLKACNDLEQKHIFRDKLLDRISSIMLVKIDAEQGWRLGLDWQDIASLDSLPLDDVYYYAMQFGNAGFAKVLLAFLHSKLSPYTAKDSDLKESLPGGDITETEDDSPTESSSSAAVAAGSEEPEEHREREQSEQPEQPTARRQRKSVKTKKKGKAESAKIIKQTPSQFLLWSDSTILDYISDGFDIKSAPVLAYRIVGQFYLNNRDYETAADIVQTGLRKIKDDEATYTVSLANSKVHLSLILGQCYTYYQAPKNFELASQLFKWILRHAPENIEAKLCEGIICRERGKNEQALTLLQQVVDAHPENTKAIYELSLCYLAEEKHEKACELLELCLTKLYGRDLLSLDLRSSIMWRLGESHWSRRSKDSSFISSALNWYVKLLKENPSYAPAYTSMGRFYDEVSHDFERASKCYYKAFELDSGEIDAAQRLATDFANQGDWEMAEVIASRVLSSDKLRSSADRVLHNWPYRVLGVASLNHKDFLKAVSYFQAALRLSSEDLGSWIGLGEAYVNSGRYTAGLKAFERAVKLDDGTRWITKVQLALIKREVFQFDGAIESLRSVLDHNPENVRSLLSETLLVSAKYLLKKDHLGEAIDNIADLISVATDLVIVSGVSTQNIWRCVADACEIFLRVQSRIDKVPFQDIHTLLSSGCDRHGIPRPEELTDLRSSSDLLVDYMLTAAKLSHKEVSSKRASKALAEYNLGLCLLKAYRWKKEKEQKREGEISGYLSESVKCLQQAIKLESRNSAFWNAYGLASSYFNVRVAQHCYIRALKFNEHDPLLWHNLAVLYIRNGDLELGLTAFEKALSIDPELSSSWVGQGIVKHITGDAEGAKKHFEHAFLISSGADAASKLVYGLDIYETALSQSFIQGSIQDIGKGILGLEQYLKLDPHNELALLLQSALLERNGNFGAAVVLISRLCEVIETRFEKDDSKEDLVKFAVAKSQLARAYLGSKQYEKAIQECEIAIGLVNDGELSDSNTYSNKITDVCHLSAILTAGLSHFFSKQFSEAVEYFKDALELSSEDTDVIVLLVQVLWAQGGEEEREVAVEQLFAKIDSSGATPVKITILLGVIGLLGSPDIIDAAREELENVSLDALLNDTDYAIPDVLCSLKGTKDSWYTMAFYRPSSYKVWKNIDAKEALEAAVTYGNIAVSDLSAAYSDAELSMSYQQMSAYLCPWKVEPWHRMSKIVAGFTHA